MKSFARNRKPKRTEGLDPDQSDHLLDAADLEIAPLGLGNDATSVAPSGVDPNANEAADFAERLGDLDRFIGGGTAPAGPVSWTGGAAARNLPAAPIPSVAPISHPRPAPVDRAGQGDGAGAAPVGDSDAEAQEFLDRLSDLDRFIGGGPAPAPVRPTVAPSFPPAGAPAVAPSAGLPADHEDEAQEFLDRLGDLDRFIGGSGEHPPAR